MTLDVGLVAHNVVDQDGQGRSMVETARALLEAGHRVTVYSRGLADDLRADVGHVPLPAPVGVAPLDDLRLFRAATRLLRRAGHDVCHQIGPVARPPGRYTYEVQFVHDAWRSTWTPQDRPDPYRRAHSHLASRLERHALPTANLVIATTTRLGREAIDQLPSGVRRPPVEVVPNGTDPSMLEAVDPAARAEARRAAGVPGGAVAIGFLGEYHTTRKGLDALVGALARLDGVHLVVGGRGDDRRLDDLARRAGVADRVHALGFVAQRAVLDAVDVVAVPSRYEPFSLVALEAAAAGLPVVCSAAVGAAEHLGDAAVVVERAADPLALAEALQPLVASPDERTRRGTAARAVAERLRWPVVKRSTVALLERVAAGGAVTVADRGTMA